jgi:hypothetical protein
MAYSQVKIAGPRPTCLICLILLRKSKTRRGPIVAPQQQDATARALQLRRLPAARRPAIARSALRAAAAAALTPAPPATGNERAVGGISPSEHYTKVTTARAPPAPPQAQQLHLNTTNPARPSGKIGDREPK